MSAITVELHPLGVVVMNEEGIRELLIEGEHCCNHCFEELLRIARTVGQFEIDPAQAAGCRLQG